MSVDRTGATPMSPEPDTDPPEPDGPRRIDRMVFVYMAAATAWILLGGVAEHWIAARTALTPVTLSVLNGVLFVLVTGLLLRAVLRRNGRRLAEAAVAERRAAARLREVARIRATFLRGISHELRTPLTNIVGYGMTLNDHLRRLDLDTAEHLTHRLVLNARKLEKLVLDLLDLDRVSRTDERAAPEPIRLDILLQDVVTRIPHKGHVIHLRAHPLVAHLDRERTERIVDELVRNAIRHVPGGCNIWVHVAARGRNVRLTVEDDGPGIDPALRNEIFEPFTQGIHAGESASPGLGIGLALISRYAALQHGRVDVAPSARGGARFEVTLPRRLSVPSGRAAGASSDRPNLVPTRDRAEID
jgi:two-component system, OmpR family, sensor histidine kinase MtrB